MNRILPAATVFLAVACHASQATQLEISAGANYADAVFEMEWPPDSGETVTVNQSLRDPVGLAGIEINIRIPSEPPVKLTASDFRGRLNNTFGGIQVPGEGMASVVVKLYQGAELVAEGHTSWLLETGIEQWSLAIERMPVAFGVRLREGDSAPRCHFPWCYQIERIEIDEIARNYPDEALWLVLDRHSSSGGKGMTAP